ncbi:hypothetical protein MMPV_005536 [Pyropia vietnamensis]
MAPSDNILDDYIPTARGVGAVSEAVEDIDGPPERAADVKCSLDLPPVYSEEQFSLATAGDCLRQDHGVGDIEDSGWVSSPGADEFSDEAAYAIDGDVNGADPVGMKPTVAHSHGVGSVDMALKRLLRVAAVEATILYEKGPGRRVAPTPQPSEVEVALGDRRRSVLARKALKKRSAYTSRFKKAVYERLLEKELVARQTRHDTVIAERDALQASVGLLRAAIAAAKESAKAKVVAQSTSPVTPAVSEAPTTAELSSVGRPMTPTKPAVETMASAASNPSTAAAEPEQPPLTWPTADKEGPGRWMLDASWTDDPFPVWEDTCYAAHAA